MKTDQEMAVAINNAQNALEAAIHDALKAGMRVNLKTTASYHEREFKLIQGQRIIKVTPYRQVTCAGV